MTMADIQLRPMEDSDLETVLAIEYRGHSHPWSEGLFEDCLSVCHPSYVLQAGPRIIGFAIMSVAVGESHILNICIDRPWQQQGFGRYLLRAMLAEARLLGAETCFLEVRRSNYAAIQLYLNESFQEVGQRRDYYPADEGREDALVFAKPLVESDA